MSNKDKIISIKITQDEFEQLRKAAEKDARTVSNVVRLLIINLIEGKITISSNVKQQ